MPLKQYQIVQKDTIDRIAQRELGDASLWYNIVTFNNLDYPYINTDLTPAQRNATGKNIKIIGDVIRIPSTAELTSEEERDFAVPAQDFYEVTFKKDIELDQDGDLVLDEATGDVRTVLGIENLIGALRRRLDTLRREMSYHPEYGSNVRLLPGEPNDERLIAQARIETAQSMLDDPRVERLDRVVAAIDLDVLSIFVTLFVQGRLAGSDAIEANFDFNRVSNG